MTISIIVAIAHQNAIGKDNDLLAYISSDLKRFKQITTGHTIIMGRRTFDSLPKGALPNRRNVVLSRQADYKAEGAEVVHSLQEALELCNKDEEVFVIGGEGIYSLFLPISHRLYITYIDHSFGGADAFFPLIDPQEWHETSREGVFNDEKSDLTYSFVNYERG